MSNPLPETMKVNVEKVWSGKFLHMYRLGYQVDNKQKVYELCSRRNGDDKHKLLIEGNDQTDAVVIVAKVGRKLVVNCEYRYSVGKWVYGLPAGIVDEGETEAEAASRELYEETGLIATKKDITRIRRHTLSTCGLTDEIVSYVYCQAKGQISNKHLDGDEKINARLMSVKDLRKLRDSDDFITARLAPIVELYCEMDDYMRNFGLKD